MNTEELGKVLEIIGSLGDNAKEGLVWYLGTSVLGSMLVALVFILLIAAFYKIALKIIEANRQEAREALWAKVWLEGWQELCELLWGATYISSLGGLNSKQKATLLQEIKRLKDLEKAL